MPNKMTKITAMVEIMEAPNPCILPAIKMVAMAMRKGNLPITRYKIICQNSNESFSRRVNNSTSNTTCRITTKSHAHGSDKMVVLESADRRGFVRCVNVKFGVYFRL